MVQDQAGLRLRRGRDTIPIVNVTAAATSRGPTHKFAQFLQPLKISNLADRNSNLFIERTRPLRRVECHVIFGHVTSVTNDIEYAK